MGGDRLLNHALNLEAARCKNRSCRGYTVTRNREPLGWTACMLAVLRESVNSEESVDRDMTRRPIRTQETSKSRHEVATGTITFIPSFHTLHVSQKE
jgi:hypothetical protein